MAAEGLSGLIPYAVNFSVVFGAAVYFGRAPLRKLVYQRHEHRRDLIDAAAAAKKSAEKRFLEVQESMKRLTEDGRRILLEAEADARSEAEQILKRADSEVTRLAKDAERILVNEEEQQAHSIREQVLDMALERAEKNLRTGMKREDHGAIIKAAKRKLEAEA